MRNLLSAVEAVHTDVKSGRRRECAVWIEDIYGFEIILLAQHIVVYVVCRCHFQAAGSEVNLHVIVFDDWHHAIYHRHHHLTSLQPLVFRVGGINADSHVTHDCLGSGGGHHGVVSAFVAVDDVAFCSQFLCILNVVGHHVILHIEEFRVLFLVYHLFIGERRQCFGVPVYHAYAAINEALAV